MKNHPGWLAAGLLLFAVLACNASKNSNNSISNNSNGNKNSSSSTRATNPDIYVERINMAKDDDGKPGDSTTSFSAGDHVIHCVIHLNKPKTGTKIRFTWVGVDVAGLAKNDDFKSIDYTTNSFENIVHAHLTLPVDWPKGSWR